MVVYIICDLYPPAWAPRVAYLTQHLEAYGWQAIVFCEEVRSHQLFDDFSPPCPVYSINLKPRWMPSALMTTLELLAEWKDRRIAKAIEHIIEKENLSPPDVILALSYRKFPFRAGAHLASKWGVSWIADCRDIVEQYSRGDFLPRPLKLFGMRFSKVERWIGARFIRQRNLAIASAHTVCTVSQWHQETLKTIHPNVQTIYNGYDASLFQPRTPQPTSRFRIVYTGRLLSLEMRNPRLLLEVLKSERLQHLPIDLIFYTDDYSASLIRSLWTDGEGYPQLKTLPMVSSRHVPDLLAKASLILLLGNEERADGPHGMISTKLFEAMAMHRPLVLLPDAASEAAQLVRQSGLGIATNSPSELEDYLLNLFAQWLEGGTTHAPKPNTQLINLYTRERQVEEFAVLLSELLHP